MSKVTGMVNRYFRRSRNHLGDGNGTEREVSTSTSASKEASAQPSGKVTARSAYQSGIVVAGPHFQGTLAFVMASLWP